MTTYEVVMERNNYCFLVEADYIEFDHGVAIFMNYGACNGFGEEGPPKLVSAVASWQTIHPARKDNDNEQLEGSEND